MKRTKRSRKRSKNIGRKEYNKNLKGIEKVKVTEIKGAAEQLPVIVYSEKAFRTLMLHMKSTHAQTKEFMMVGSVDRKDNVFNITNFYLPPNKSCSGSYCESGDSYDSWFFETFKTIEEKKSVRCHLHSHVKMKAFPSGTDSKQIMELYGAVSDYYIQIIINHDFENYVAIYTKGLLYEEVPQLIQIGDMLIDFKSLKSASANYGIEDGTYEIKDGQLLFEDGVRYDIKKADWIIESEGLTYSDGKISMIPKAEELKDINASFAKMCPVTYTSPPYSGSFGGPYYDSYNRGPYYGGEKPAVVVTKDTETKPAEQASNTKNEDNPLNDPFFVADERKAAELINELRKRGVIS
jgi:hypothetical protein